MFDFEVHSLETQLDMCVCISRSGAVFSRIARKCSLDHIIVKQDPEVINKTATISPHNR